jgi:hypothetical protein
MHDGANANFGFPSRRASLGRSKSWGVPTLLEATWSILPVVICLSQRLSHACLSMNYFRL